MPIQTAEYVGVMDVAMEGTTHEALTFVIVGCGLFRSEATK
jgi:hypothetical protein